MSLIQIRGVVKAYNGSSEVVRAVNGISMRIDEGEFLAVVGPSGSGKSTLLSVLGGLNRPTEGRVTVDDIDLYSLHPERLADFRREYIGFVFQSFQLVPYLTVIENVMLPLSVTGHSDREQTEMAERMLDQVDLEKKSGRLPDELSGGEQERAAIARALVNEPPIILADEPTGNLDSVSSEGVMKLLQQLNNSGKTIVMVTHNHENVKFARRRIGLRDGAVVEDVGIR